MIPREEVVRVARSYLGVKFRFYGRSHTGVDCVGLLYCIGEEIGMKIEKFTNYSRGPEVEKVNRILDAYTNPVKSTTPRNGRIVKLRQSVFPMHFGIVVVEHGKVSIINANIMRKQVVEEPFSSWKNFVMGYREIKGVGG